MITGIRIAFATVFASVSGIANAQMADSPFGVTMGSKIESYPTCKVGSGGRYFCSTLPRPHPDIDSYLIQANERDGVCWIKGIGRQIDTSVYGHNIRNNSKEFADQIAQRYGPYKHVDMLDYGSIWNEPKDWMMSLVKDERRFNFQWNLSSGNIKTIFVSPRASNTGKAYTVIEFAFKNEDKCDQFDKSKKSSTF